jgi:hypothetical protein
VSTIILVISIPYEGAQGYSTTRFRKLRNEITYSICKQYDAVYKASKATQGGFVDVSLKAVSRPDMADFMATVKADIKRTFKINVATNWIEVGDEEEPG